MIRQPKDFPVRRKDEIMGHWLLLAVCLVVVMFICSWALGEALLAALRSMPP